MHTMNNLRWPSVLGGIRYTATRNVLSPLITSILIVSPVAMVCGVYLNNALGWFITSIGSMPVILLAIFYIYFALKDPNRLHDDQTHTEWRRLEIMGDSSSPRE